MFLGLAKKATRCPCSSNSISSASTLLLVGYLTLFSGFLSSVAEVAVILVLDIYLTNMHIISIKFACGRWPFWKLQRVGFYL